MCVLLRTTSSLKMSALNRLMGSGLFAPALDRMPEECVASDLVAGGFTTDVSEGGETLAIPFVAAVEYVYSGRQAHLNATCLFLNRLNVNANG